MRGARRLATVATALAAAATAATPAPGYVPLTLAFVAGEPVVARWPEGAFPVPLRVSPSLSSDIADSSELPALTAALDRWSAVEGSAAALVLVGEEPVQAGVLDGVNAIEFSDAEELEFEAAIALTFLLVEADGTVVEADILVNDRRFGFNTDGGNAGLDLETVLTHELGHLLGLDHSPLGSVERDRTITEGSAVMYPVPRPPGQQGRTLQPDDAAGIAALYPEGDSFGAIAGRVVRQGSALFGAHVLAFEPLRQVLVGAVSLPDGSFRIGGLPPGRYLIRVQPLAEPAGPGTLGGIFASSELATGFAATFLDSAVQVRAGSVTAGVTVEVP